MLFGDDIALLEFIHLTRGADRVFRDDKDPDVDQLLNSSPPLTGQSATFDIDSSYLAKNFEDDIPIEENTTINIKTLKTTPNKNLFPIPIEGDNIFSPIIINKKEVDLNIIKMETVSKLTQLLEAKKEIDKTEQNDVGKTKLSIYLPDFSSMTILVHDSNTFHEIIKKILTVHKTTYIQPPLRHTSPQLYELRMHEGDGEPDRDFPALDRTKQLKQFNESEYCLCEIEDEDEDFQGGTSMLNAPLTRDRSQTIVIDATKISVQIPNVGEVKIPFFDNTRFRDLLLEISKKHRLGLLTDEYQFSIANVEDQTRLKMSAPIVDLETTVKQFGVYTYELQKKTYADSIRISKPVLKGGIGVNNRQGNTAPFVYTEATAMVYQEWRIVKKNKYGQKQPRIIGVDGKLVYNSKRDKDKSSKKVFNAQREVKDIRKIEPIEGDPASFKITWENSPSELIDIEYSCESVRDCLEIIGKITFLLSILRKKASKVNASKYK
jgi:hypothetical protein